MISQEEITITKVCMEILEFTQDVFDILESKLDRGISNEIFKVKRELVETILEFSTYFIKFPYEIFLKIFQFHVLFLLTFLKWFRIF